MEMKSIVEFEMNKKRGWEAFIVAQCVLPA